MIIMIDADSEVSVGSLAMFCFGLAMELRLCFVR